MSQELSTVGAVVEHAEVIQHGEKLILPTGMTPKGAVELLLRRMEYDEQQITMQEEFNVFPWDGAHGLFQVLTKRFGWASTQPTPGFFGSKPPQKVTVETGFNQKTSILWGQFSLPGIEGTLHCSTKVGHSGRVTFLLGAKIKRKYEAFVQSIFIDLREYLRENSLYKGKALRIRFKNEGGEALEIPEIKFLDPNAITPDKLILSKHLFDAVDTNLYTPIRRVRELRANGIPVKRGILLGGTYGTGKTLASAVACNLAVKAGVMYLAVDRADELAGAIEFARQYEDPAAVVFCEDIDRVTSGERGVDMDDLLNIIDGIDSKSSNLIIVLTTNDLNSINPAMLRPGRLDAVIEITPPDAEAIERLLRFYGDDCIDPRLDLSSVGKVLEGSIPAVVEEVVKKAKLAQLRRLPVGHLVEDISVEALLESARTMQGQLNLLQSRINEPKSTEPSFKAVIADGVVHALGNSGGEMMERILRKQVEHIVGKRT